MAEYNEMEAPQNGAALISAGHFLGTSDFWFQSMQDRQSEFLAVGVLILLSIVLRQHGRPESKPVTAARRDGRLSRDRRRRQAATGSRLAKQARYGLSTYSPYTGMGW
ncbi:DUF6766 family protein [Micromonospora sp. MS34]|uniref:DUF6766 family protein n=1 Tax=Micromonospora sp. MS34 TaxID=3385971 RepID=UPI00399F1A65